MAEVSNGVCILSRAIAAISIEISWDIQLGRGHGSRGVGYLVGSAVAMVERRKAKVPD
jgi:hypothetical protein